METIKKHIKEKHFEKIYLLYGKEAYLKKLYKQKLKDAILEDGDEMNFTYFEGAHIDEAEVRSVAETLPFFRERRLIMLENTGFFKKAGELADYIKEMPDSTCMVFVEQDVDKRNKLYKAANTLGHVAEMNQMDERNLTLWLASEVKKSGKKIKESTTRFFLEKVGTDMTLLQGELEKVICYAMDREEITADDIMAVCTVQMTGKIFQMIDAVASGNQHAALTMYYELLALREKPLSILFLLSRHFNILLQVKELLGKGAGNAEIAKKVGVPPFTIKKYSAQAGKFTGKVLKEALTVCISTEESIKTGNLAEQIGVELLLIQLSDRKVKDIL